MPSKIYVSEIKENDKVESYFLVKDKSVAMAKSGKPSDISAAHPYS